MDDMGDMEDVNLEDVVTDSEEEYTETEKKLLEKVRKQQTTEDFDSDDEVYKLQDSDKEEEDEDEDEEDDEQDLMGSDIEGLEEDDDDDDVLNDKAWGTKAKTFYSSDFKYTDYAIAPEKDLINAEIEEEEGRRLHLRLMGQYVVPESVNLSEIAQLAEYSKEDEEDDKKYSVQTSKEEEKSFMFMVNMFKSMYVKKK